MALILDLSVGLLILFGFVLLCPLILIGLFGPLIAVPFTVGAWVLLTTNTLTLKKTKLNSFIDVAYQSGTREFRRSDILPWAIGLVVISISIANLPLHRTNISATSHNSNETDFEQVNIPMSTRASLEEFCARSSESCQDEARHRTVQLQSPGGQGTGFILRSDREYMIVLTAAHVVWNKTDNGTFLQKSVLVNDYHLGNQFAVYRVCAKSSTASDLAVVLVPNFRNEIFIQPKLAHLAATQPIIISEFSGERPSSWMSSAMKSALFGGIAIFDSVWPGVSGSPVLSIDGKIAAIVQSASTQLDQLGFGSDELSEFLDLRWRDLKSLSEDNPAAQGTLNGQKTGFTCT